LRYAPQLQWLSLEYNSIGEAGTRALDEAARLLPGLRLSL